MRKCTRTSVTAKGLEKNSFSRSIISNVLDLFAHGRINFVICCYFPQQRQLCVTYLYAWYFQVLHLTFVVR